MRSGCVLLILNQNNGIKWNADSLKQIINYLCMCVCVVVLRYNSNHNSNICITFDSKNWIDEFPNRGIVRQSQTTTTLRNWLFLEIGKQKRSGFLSNCTLNDKIIVIIAFVLWNVHAKCT